jgi:hypothetical protein
MDKSLNETVTDKIRKYRADCNNNPPHTVSFMSDILSTSGRLHSEFIRLLFLQTHRETDRFFAVSGAQLPETDRGLFHFRRYGDVLGHPESKSRQNHHQDCSFTYYTQYCWVTYHFKNTYSPITLANISSIDLVSIFRCSSSPSNPVCVRCVDFSDIVFSLSSHRHSYVGLVFRSRFIDS